MLNFRWLLIACVSMRVHAEDLAVNAQKLSGKPLVNFDVWQWLLALIFVLAIFLTLAWLLKKTGNLSLNSKSELNIVAGLSLGVREKLVLINVGEKQLLLSVTPGRIDKLLELEGDQRLGQAQNMGKEYSGFSKMMQDMLQGKSNA